MRSSNLRRPRGHLALTLATAAVLLASCEGGSAPPPSSGAPTAMPSLPTATAGPVATGSPAATGGPAAASPRADALEPGALAVTVSDRVRVRSAPRVATDSTMYEPLLPTGTQVVITGGPVAGSGYSWFRVVPLGVTLSGGAEEGWVAVADHDGTPWIALAKDPTPGFELARADAPRSVGSLADARVAAASINRFGVELFRRTAANPALAREGKGVVVSPTSILIALAMARAGARGTTAAEMDEALAANGWDELATGINALQQRLESLDGVWTDDGGTDHALALRMANMAFAQDGWPIEPAYLDAIAEAIGSGLGLVDYQRDTAGARKAINGWVARQTANRIPQLLGPLDLTNGTRLALVNAIYLKAKWQLEFDRDATATRAFTLADGTVVRVPTMSLFGEQEVPYARGNGWQATELRYMGPDGTTPLAMSLILPDDLARFEDRLTASRLDSIVSRLDAQRDRLAVIHESTTGGDCDQTFAYTVHLFLPRFGIDTRADLVPSLEAMGMTSATDPRVADFSGIVPPDRGRLFISKVIHQANIDVDEEGTEAAAATAVVMGDTTGGCTPQAAKTVTLRLNRPFLFVLRDVTTGAILFMGGVNDPTQR